MEWWGYLLTISGGISTIGGAIVMIRKLMSPLFEQNKRIAALELHEKRDLEKFDNISDKFAVITHENQVILTALHAILSHLKSGNDTGAMEKALNELVKHIIED